MTAMTERDRKDGADAVGLDAFFAAAREEPLAPSGDFMAALEASALAELPPPEALVRAAGAPRVGRWRQALQALGGWPGAAGLVAACAAGLWFGVSQPQDLYDLWTGSDSYTNYAVDPLSGYDMALLEG